MLLSPLAFKASLKWGGGNLYKYDSSQGQLGCKGLSHLSLVTSAWHVHLSLVHLSLVTPTWHVHPGVQVLLPHLVPRKKSSCNPNQEFPYVSCGTLSRPQAFPHLLVSATPSLNLGTFSCCAPLWHGACHKAAFKPICLDTSCSQGPLLLWCHLLPRELLPMVCYLCAPSPPPSCAEAPAPSALGFPH